MSIKFKKKYAILTILCNPEDQLFTFRGRTTKNLADYCVTAMSLSLSMQRLSSWVTIITCKSAQIHQTESWLLQKAFTTGEVRAQNVYGVAHVKETKLFNIGSWDFFPILNVPWLAAEIGQLFGKDVYSNNWF